MTAKAKAGLLLGVVALLAIACGSGGNSPQNTDVPLTTCKPASSPVFAPPIGVPADQQVYQSSELGYSILYPADWQAKPGQANYQNVYGDTFFAPGFLGEVLPNVTITCETIPAGSDTNAYADYRRAVLQQLLGTSPDSAASLKVDGKDAFFWHYKITSTKTPQPAVIEKIEVLFADDRGGWMISLVAPEGHLGDYKTALDDVTASFHEQ
jgi:hypothetical protein